MRAAEEAKLENAAPESASDYDKLVLGNPNNSFLWVKYIAFYLQVGTVYRLVGGRLSCPLPLDVYLTFNSYRLSFAACRLPLVGHRLSCLRLPHRVDMTQTVHPFY